METFTTKVWKLGEQQAFKEFKSPAAMLVALALARFGHYTGQVLVKQAGIAHGLGISKQTVARCLDELEEVGWVSRVPRRHKDGSRAADVIWLTLPEVTLEATTVDQNSARRLAGMLGEDGARVDSQDTTVVDDKISGRDSQGASVTTQNESLNIRKGISEGARASADPHPGPDIDAAVDLIWQRASKIGRQRSSKADIGKALRAALGRGHDMERILKGLGAYFASPDATKDDGAFQKGAHTVLANDRWESFLDDDQARRERAEEVTPAQQRALDELGTLEEPSPARQRVWMDLFQKGMPWDPDRGPQPGRMGCRVDPAIQREFDVEPWAPEPEEPTPAASPPGDDAAFD